MTVRNVYECGCIEYDVSCVSRCEAHGKMVHARWSTSLPPNVNKRIHRRDGITVVLNDIHESLNRIEDSSISLICTYPNQSEYYARQVSDFLRMPDMFFKHYYRVLKQDGLVVLFVEPDVLAAAVYSATCNNFSVNSITQTVMQVSERLNCYTSILPKMCVVLSKGGNDRTLNNFTFKTDSRFFSVLGVNGTVLDTTCLFSPIVVNAAKTNKTIGLCYDVDIFNQLVSTFR